MKPLSEHLVALIATAEDIVRASSEAPLRLRPGFAELANAIRRAHELPSVGVRATRAGVIMVTAIEGFANGSADRWQMLIGAALPLLRQEAWQALRNEKEERQAELAGGYRR